MGLETGTGIGDLVPTNPLSTDAVSAGDDHIRLIKTVMQSITFLKSIQTFTASGTWTRPTNVRQILVYCLGGGAGGGFGGLAGYSGGGGASGATAIKWVDVTAISSATVSIGQGGAGGSGAVLGANGGATSFVVPGPVTVCQAREGLAGTGQAVGGLAQPRAVSTGDILFPGANGSYGQPPQGTAALFGGTGGGTAGGSDTAAQANSGGGGGGGSCTNIAGNPGGAGGSGYCIVFEFGW
jgi:hypothetical protein